MIERAGPSFVFSIKAHETLTHRVNPGAWEGKAKTYLTALEPLLKTGRLGAVLFQFPYSFHYEPDQRRYLDKLLAYFKDIPSAVEFRNADWINTRVIEGLRKRGAALASLDMPDLKGLPPDTDVATSPLAYVRLHGRNKEAWWGSDAAARVLVYFNNHRRGQAAGNAQTLAKILEKAGLLKGWDLGEGNGGCPI
jgi:uncharacterized protein YecE (DUF72 family)